ncbi:MAG: glycoside hydrolase family 57 protein [Candidatus Saccharicenans sp.]|nr:glycoside hydrolase family 57 protein [Candidatus Saccharicenans sp.]MDI6850051.1 glycoside hydrolase family 57 protein [Candidatus Saccharicenans sp.]
MRLNFVWHFHQPVYHLPDSRTYLLPWVNFHATRNYWQMLKIVEEAGFPCTINLVPCLLEQLVDYAEGRADDRLLESLQKRPEELSPEEIADLKRFFPRFHHEETAAGLQRRVLEFFFSPLARPEEKSREQLLSLRKDILSGLLPYFRQLRSAGLLELTVTPYYHPLLPLLADLGQAGTDAPDLPPFRHPEDAAWHLDRAREYFSQLLGFLPAGLWPSEGALSQATCALIAGSGFEYAMTDEHLLWKSLDHRPDPELLYQPYDCQGVNIFFRDRELSDLIGFEYHRWPAERAVDDFLRKLEKRAAAVPDKAICSIILDGENPWGAYKNNGIDFLRLLFEKVKTSGHFQPVQPGAYLGSHRPEKSLELVSGTWMSNFFKWVGHPEKVRTWMRLARQREDSGFSEYLAVAEGSDWFWWAGETEEKEFDLLFSSYLEKAAGREK